MITDQYQYHEPLGNGKVLEKDFRPPGKIEDVKEEEPGWNNFRLRVMHEEVQGAQGGDSTDFFFIPKIVIKIIPKI